MTPNAPPLAGLRVLDLSRILAGPVCTQLLADLGADVVKVERPGLGDDTRQWGPPFLPDGGPSGYYLSCNRGKRSLALDLGSDEGRRVVQDLVACADVLVENFLPDSLAKLGLLPDQLAGLNPRLVSCSISGFGRTGPLADVPGYDLLMQAGAGLMSITGEPDGAPMKVGVAITDVVTGLYAAATALAGVIGQRQGQTGRAFDLALADCTLASLVNVVQGALLTDARPQRWGNAHPQIVPYEIFATADGHLALGVGADRQWRSFCERVDRSAWSSDPRFATNPARVEHRAALVPLLTELFRSRTTFEWQQALAGGHIPHGPVLAVDEALESPQFAAREMVYEVADASGRRFRLLGSVVHCHDEQRAAPRPPPELGQHTDEVLAEWLGYDQERIAALRIAGAVA